MQAGQVQETDRMMATAIRRQQSQEFYDRTRPSRNMGAPV